MIARSELIATATLLIDIAIVDTSTVLLSVIKVSLHVELLRFFDLFSTDAMSTVAHGSLSVCTTSARPFVTVDRLVVV